MHVTETPLLLELRDSEGRQMGEGRGVGLHLGDVITYMRMAVDKKFRRMKEAQARGESGPGSEMFMANGFLFEILLTKAFAEYMRFQRPVVRPPETEVDGILMNADGITLDDAAIDEYKATYRSLKWLGLTTDRVLSLTDQPFSQEEREAVQIALEQNFWYFLVQIKSYCRAWKTSRANLIMWFACGDYRFPIRPVLLALRLDFEPGELEFNWEMVRNNAATMQQQVEQPAVIMPLEDEGFDRRFEQ